MLAVHLIYTTKSNRFSSYFLEWVRLGEFLLKAAQIVSTRIFIRTGVSDTVSYSKTRSEYNILCYVKYIRIAARLNSFRNMYTQQPLQQPDNGVRVCQELHDIRTGC